MPGKQGTTREVAFWGFALLPRADAFGGLRGQYVHAAPIRSLRALAAASSLISRELRWRRTLRMLRGRGWLAQGPRCRTQYPPAAVWWPLTWAASGCDRGRAAVASRSLGRPPMLRVSASVSWMLPTSSPPRTRPLMSCSSAAVRWGGVPWPPWRRVERQADSVAELVVRGQSAASVLSQNARSESTSRSPSSVGSSVQFKTSRWTGLGRHSGRRSPLAEGIGEPGRTEYRSGVRCPGYARGSGGGRRV